jgi:hypothetical protein
LFKQALAAVEDAQLDRRLSSKEDALRFVGQQFPLHSSGS